MSIQRTGTIYHDALIELDTPYGYLENVPAQFTVRVERFPAEPYSHGGSRGTETEITAHLSSITFNNLRLGVHESIKAFGHEAIARNEKAIEENFDAPSC